MFNRIPPVGNPIQWWGSSPAPKLTLDSEQCLFLNSGTAALATAIEIARKFSNTEQPEIIMPGYACPDIITAAVYAGVTPVLVDLEPDSSYMSLQAITEAITDSTIAITALNFLGIPERISDIKNTIGERNILIIEDSAQWFPNKSEQPISTAYNGDLVVLSFGKGKPISLLGGGALLIKHPQLNNLAEITSTANGSMVNQCKQQLLPFIYNRVISHYFYWLLEAVPFIELGKTEFKLMDEVSTLSPSKLKRLSSNIRRYQQADKKPQKQFSKIPSNDIIVNLPKVCTTYSDQRLLRYPVLLPNNKRDVVLNKLINAGCGASPLYKTALPQIDGVGEKVKTTSNLPNAKDFAERLITLPTHVGVTTKHCNMIKQIFNENH